MNREDMVGTVTSWLGTWPVAIAVCHLGTFFSVRMSLSLRGQHLWCYQPPGILSWLKSGTGHQDTKSERVVFIFFCYLFLSFCVLFCVFSYSLFLWFLCTDD